MNTSSFPSSTTGKILPKGSNTPFFIIIFLFSVTATCGQEIFNNVTYFVNPDFPSLSRLSTTCTINIKKVASGVSQLRLDFEHFVLVRKINRLYRYLPSSLSLSLISKHILYPVIFPPPRYTNVFSISDRCGDANKYISRGSVNLVWSLQGQPNRRTGHCETDMFHLSAGASRELKLCGQNSGQHGMSSPSLFLKKKN